MVMKVLITGGAGFVGSHLAELLLARGDRVVAVDDLSTGGRENIAAIDHHKNFQLVVGSVLDDDLIDPLVRDVDLVFHLASTVGVRLVVENPLRTIKTIVRGTEALLDAAQRHRRRILITSSSEVYGKGSRVPFSESDDVVFGPTTIPRWSFAASKMLDEFMALAHWHETQLPVVCARLFNTVGPRQTGRYGMVLPQFVKQALTQEALTVYGDGKQTRCFGHVADVTDALVTLIDCTQALGRVVNIGSDQEVSIDELARRVIGRTSAKSQIVHVPYEQAYGVGYEDMPRRVPDLTLARELIGYRPRYDLDSIIDSIVAYQRGDG